MLQKICYDVVFNPSKKWSRTGDGMIMVRASQGRKSVDIPTNIYCQSKQFSNGYINSLHPQYEGLNAMLDQIILNIQATEIEAFRKDINMTVQRLYSMYVEGLNTSVPLSQFAESVFKNSSTKRRDVTIKRYRDALKNVEQFSPGTSMEDIDLSWINKYESWMKDRGNSDSTVWSRMKFLRMLFNEAIKRDLLKPWQTPFKNYEIPELRSRTDVLRFSEMEELLFYKFEDPKLRKARDFFMLSCYTGLRYGDMIRLTSDNIRVINGETWLTIKTHKTGILVQIPLSIIFYGRAMDILRRYKCIEDIVDYKWNSTINYLIRDMLQISHIGGSQRITVHTARRSCLTGLADFGVNVYTIQRIAGHARITTTQKYIQMSTATIEADLRKAFPRDCEIIIPEALQLPKEVELCEAEEIK